MLFLRPQKSPGRQGILDPGQPLASARHVHHLSFPGSHQARDGTDVLLRDLDDRLLERLELGSVLALLCDDLGRSNAKLVAPRASWSPSECPGAAHRARSPRNSPLPPRVPREAPGSSPTPCQAAPSGSYWSQIYPPDPQTDSCSRQTSSSPSVPPPRWSAAAPGSPGHTACPRCSHPPARSNSKYPRQSPCPLGRG